MSGSLTIVSGKGGVGKTTVAAALAQGFARQGRATVLVEIGRDQGRHSVFDIETGYEPVVVEPHLNVMRIDARLALKEYVRRYMTFSVVYRRLLDRGPVRRLLDALPIFDELMCLGKLYDLVCGKETPFERVVLDAPSTGHARTLLNVPGVATSLLLAGPVRYGAQRIVELLTDPERARMVIVTLAEDTPSREAAELAAFCHDEISLRCDELVVNRCFAQRFTAKELDAVGRCADRHPELTAMHEIVTAEAGIAAQQARYRQRLDDSFETIVAVPQLVGADRDEKLEAFVPRLEPLLENRA